MYTSTAMIPSMPSSEATLPTYYDGSSRSLNMNSFTPKLHSTSESHGNGDTNSRSRPGSPQGKSKGSPSSGPSLSPTRQRTQTHRTTSSPYHHSSSSSPSPPVYGAGVGVGGCVEGEELILPVVTLTRSEAELEIEELKKIALLGTYRKKGGKNYVASKQHGWTLKKGWAKRPIVSGVESDVIDENIRRWKGKQEYARASRSKGCGLGISTRNDPTTWPQSTNQKPGQVLIPLVEEKVAPAPRYNLRKEMPGKKYNNIWERQPQVNLSRAKDITFSTRTEPKDKFGTMGAGTNLTTPGCIYDPESVQRHKGVYRLGVATGRTHNGSIYYASMNTATPGSAWHVTSADKKQSWAIPCKGMSMGLNFEKQKEYRDGGGCCRRPRSPGAEFLANKMVYNVLAPWEKRKNEDRRQGLVTR